MRTWSRERRGRALTAAAVALLAIAVVAVHLPFLHTGEFDWDEGVYWLSLRSMQAGHPLFAAVYSSQPPAFLGLTEPPWAALGGGIAAARAVMLAWAAVAVAAAGVVGWRLGGHLSAVVAAAVVAVDPLMIRQAAVLQADGPAVALGLLALALAAVAVTTRGRGRDVAAVLGGAALVLGVLTKLIDVAIVPGAVVLVAGRPGARRAVAGALVGGLVAAAAVLLPLHGAWTAVWQQSVGLHVDTRHSTAGIGLRTALTLRWKLTAAALLAGVFAVNDRRRLLATGISCLAGAALAMALTHPLWPHHAVAMLPGIALVAAAGAPGVARAARRLGAGMVPAAQAAAVLAAAAVALASAYSGLHGLRAINHLGPLAAVLDHTTSPSGEVLGDEQFAQALAGRQAPPQFVDTSNTRMYAEPGAVAHLEATADGTAPVCSVLFATGRLRNLPGFASWVEAHYPQQTVLGSAVLHTAPGCR